MQEAAFDAGSSKDCYFCNKPASNGKKCSRCKIALYCDATCQKEDWKVHKKACMDHEKQLENQPHLKVVFDEFLPWMKKWRLPLETWSTFAMDIANKDPKHLTTHGLLLEVSQRGDGNKKATLFELKRVMIRTDAQMEQEIRRAYNGIYEDSTEEPLARWRRLVRAEDWIRVCIIVGPVAFPMCFPVITDGTDIGRDRLLSRMLAANWKAPFMDAMESGKLDAHEKFLKATIEDQHALNVD